MSKGATVIGRYIIPSTRSLHELVERTEDTIWITKNICAQRYTIRGVPGKRFDVVAQQGLSVDDFSIVEVVEKSGKYDGSIRQRLTIRQCDLSLICLEGYMEVSYEDNKLFSVSINNSMDESPEWTFETVPLRARLRDYSPFRLVRWHWSRYFNFLSWEDVEGLAKSFTVDWYGETLAEANRRASRGLYDLARQLGWRKLTLKEQERLELTGAWHREEVCAERMSPRSYVRDGVSDHTHVAATGAENILNIEADILFVEDADILFRE